jgi:hypothetical protein
MYFPFFQWPEGSKQVFFESGHQGQFAKPHHYNFHGWGTY